MTAAGLARPDITALLDDLSAELAAAGASADLFLVGGAAIAIAYDSQRSTRDLDAVFLPTDVVRRAAAAVANRRGLAADWLNDAVKGYLPGTDPEAWRFYESPSLKVDVASARYLLAMKLFAARVENDVDDIMLLYRQLGYTTVDEGLDLVESVYQGRPIEPKVQFLLEEVVAALNEAPQRLTRAASTSGSRRLCTTRSAGASRRPNWDPWRPGTCRSSG